jgi:hypothetical protein
VKRSSQPSPNWDDPRRTPINAVEEVADSVVRAIIEGRERE